MLLYEAVARAFSPQGALARCVDAYRPRPGQTLMAEAVARTIEVGGVLVVEAGTGIGKTYAYLVPALLSGERILLSTATKTLQDQLFGRDIPLLIAALGLPVRTALLKGRSSYLCLNRLELVWQDLGSLDNSMRWDLEHIRAWSATTRAGDMSELVRLDERSEVIALVTSTRENCLGSLCPQSQACHVNRARREAMAADVVVINHHLFFADLNIRESGVAELLPTVHCVVFDEAHQLNEIGVQFLGRQLTTGQLDSYCRDIALRGHHLTLVAGDWRAMVSELNRCIVDLRTLSCKMDPSVQIDWHEDEPTGIAPQDWQRAVKNLHAALQQTDIVFRSIEEISPDLKALRERSAHLMATLDVFSHEVQPGWVRWLEIGQQVRMVQSPLDIADAMRSRVIPPEAGADGRKSWIFTSATLDHDAGMANYLKTCGLDGAQVMQVASPFDYATQAAMYIPSHFPKPADSTHSTSVALLVMHGASVLGGRTLVLTTSLRAMRDIANTLRQQFPPYTGMKVLVQGESPKRELTERFTQGSANGSAGCILVASASYWEGIDVPGDALQMVVIDKLPFSPPSDPLMQARSRQLRANGKNPFQSLHVPHAAIALKQGAGRLIRRETDRGILVVCDVRLIQMAYGRRILAALPSMPSITNQDQFTQALLALTKPSTKGH